MHESRCRPTKVIAHYLPQFHPTDYNSEWWGPGFTEWHTVSQARPLFRGHRQPVLPGELGFYDLRLKETREQQARLAAGAGITGFCYWHYWFSGERMLNQPLDEVLKSNEPNYPFCLAWANESWTATWVGQGRRVLVRQRYSEDDFRAHADYLAGICMDGRYIHVDGRPLIYVYRPLRIPNPVSWRELWADRFVMHGIEPPLIVGEVRSPHERSAARDIVDLVAPVYWDAAFGVTQKVRRRLPGGPLRLPYSTAARDLSVAHATQIDHSVPVALSGWDNTPRYGRRGVVLEDFTPSTWSTHLTEARNASQSTSNVMMIKSWNEWSEGNMLEPTYSGGRALLDATARVLAHNARQEEGQS